MLVRMFAAGWVIIATTLLSTASPADGIGQSEIPLYVYLSNRSGSTMIAYTPLGLDPRYEPNNLAHPTSALRADLQALRPAFDGLVLYGYHHASTPRILALAKDLKFRAVLLGIWQPKSASEVDGVAALVNQFKDDMALGVLVGNEGITFKRYETDDLKFAANRLRQKIPANIPLSTSEPLVGYKSAFIHGFGDFLAPNIHPVFDRPNFGETEAAAWARGEAIALAKQTGKRVLLKETGFPHAGKEKFTPQSQKEFWSAYTSPGIVARPSESKAGDSKTAWVYFGVAFEAFDLPWKAEASKLEIEKSWGLLSTQRKPYPAFDVWRQLARSKP